MLQQLFDKSLASYSQVVSLFNERVKFLDDNKEN